MRSWSPTAWVLVALATLALIVMLLQMAVSDSASAALRIGPAVPVQYAAAQPAPSIGAQPFEATATWVRLSGPRRSNR